MTRPFFLPGALLFILRELDSISFRLFGICPIHLRKLVRAVL